MGTEAVARFDGTEKGRRKLLLGFEQRPEIVKAVEKLPHVSSGALLAVTMQTGQRRVVQIVVESVAGAPLDEDQDLPRFDITMQALAETAEGDDPSAVPLNFRRRTPRVREVFLSI
jgi:hypothetical protein